MAKDAMVNHRFEELLSNINQETKSANQKLEILYNSRGYFSGHQASQMLYAFGAPQDKLRAMRVIEPRLARMTTSEARDILGAFSIHNDRVTALGSIKRALCDSQTRDGVETILSAFPYENDKYRAMQILRTVRSDVFDAMPSGGHQGYAALGGLYTQCRPLETHLFGSVEEQEKLRPGKGKIEVPIHASTRVIPSVYTGHPSYAFNQGRDYAEDRQYPGTNAYGDQSYYKSSTGECPAKDPLAVYYPSGAPPLGQHQNPPAPTGFQGMANGM